MTTGPRPEYDLRAWRERIPILSSLVPMSNCSQTPQTDRTREAAERYLESWNRDGMDWERWTAEVEGARAAFARLIGAEPHEISITSSVSAAVAGLGSALDVSSPRNKVVVSGAEFPTVVHVWLARERLGARIGRVPVRDGVVRLEDYDAEIDEETLLVSATHAYYQNGFVQDVGAIASLAHERGALAFVDAYQTLGTRPVDVKALGVDALASGCLKFLMGVPGIAFLYVREALAERLRPALTGWFGQAEEAMFDPSRLCWAPGARRFDTGTPPLLNAYIARAGIEIIEEVGPERIRRWIEVLSGRLLEGGEARGLALLGPREPGRRNPTSAFLVPGDARAVEAEMRRRGIIASARGPAVRLAPHFFTSLEDVDRSLDALAGAVDAA
ncbi:MAG: aminotransferase class V-fold PLP-dependent enzyme [Gemmatimonadota bacterium]